MTSLLSRFLVVLLLVGSTASAAVIQNAPNGGTISTFGFPNSQTYGQVFTSPVTGTLDSFTLFLNGGVGELLGGVGVWNGPANWATGFGVSSTLYTSATVTSLSAGAYTFAPNINVVAGQRYVAYLSVFGVAGANNFTSMPLGDNSDPNINYFVWNNTSSPVGNPSWNYFSNFGEAQFKASFTQTNAVPEPNSLFVFGLAGLCLGVRSRNRKS